MNRPQRSSQIPRYTGFVCLREKAKSSLPSSSSSPGKNLPKRQKMCNFYSVRKFRILCGISVILGFLACVLSTVSVSTNTWIIGEVRNATAGQLYRMVTGMWDMCAEYYQTGENGDIEESIMRYCSSMEYVITIVLQDESLLSYYKSFMAFELISVLAVFIGTVIAAVALVQQHPLAVLVAGFTMLFSGLFMIVGHVMFLSFYIVEEEEEAGVDNETAATADDDVTETFYLGWSFILAWTAFLFCLISGAILLQLYRVCRNYMDEYGNHNPPRIKKVQRPPAVNVDSTI